MSRKGLIGKLVLPLDQLNKSQTFGLSSMLPKGMRGKQAVSIGEPEIPGVRAPNLTAVVHAQDTGPGAGPPIHCLSTRRAGISFSGVAGKRRRRRMACRANRAYPRSHFTPRSCGRSRDCDRPRICVGASKGKAPASRRPLPAGEPPLPRGSSPRRPDFPATAPRCAHR
jgi:hypothetical protein